MRFASGPTTGGRVPGIATAGARAAFNDAKGKSDAARKWGREAANRLASVDARGACASRFPQCYLCVVTLEGAMLIYKEGKLLAASRGRKTSSFGCMLRSLLQSAAADSSQ